jgi:PAS domain-containing protein
MREYTGSPLEELTGWGWRSMIHPEDLPKFTEEWNSARAAGKPFQNEARIRRADSQYRWFSEERKQAEFYPAEGQRLAQEPLPG